ncbi:MAG: response regulator [bacterium]|nr:response regulator [bacterium]MBU1916568.1 response regulator [bacterium]
MSEIVKKILHVDDEPDISYVIEFLLTNGGFEVKTLDDSSLAVAELLNQDYAMVIIDLMMPKLNGFQLLEAIRKEDKLEKLPVLVLSSRQLVNDEIDFLNNLKAYIASKPFEPYRLLEKVREIITS